ncbi:MAG: hypothetical protein ACREP7_21625 [Lysobacter sp.]
MKSTVMAMMAAIVAMAACAGVVAGEKANVPVTFSNNPQGQPFRAFGMLGTARNSADSKQSIGCATTVDSNALRADCEAQNAAGTYVHCMTTNAALVTVAQSISSDSYLAFNFDSAGICTSIYVSNGSSNAVKLP